LSAVVSKNSLGCGYDLVNRSMIVENCAVFTRLRLFDPSLLPSGLSLEKKTFKASCGFWLERKKTFEASCGFWLERKKKTFTLDWKIFH